MAMNDRLEVIGTGCYLGSIVIPTEYFVGKRVYAYNKDGERVDQEGKVSTLDAMLSLTGTERDKETGVLKSDFGIKTRRWATEEETIFFMALQASIRAIEDAGVDFMDIKGIVTATVSTPLDFPNFAQYLQDNLAEHYGKKRSNVELVENVQHACAGFPRALMTASSYQRDGHVDGLWLVVGGDDVKRMWREDDMNAFLFGAGLGAFVLRPTKDAVGLFPRFYFKSGPHEGGRDVILRDKYGYGVMTNGQAVLKRAIKSMSRGFFTLENINRAIATHSAPHQANGRITLGVKDNIHRLCREEIVLSDDPDIREEELRKLIPRFRFEKELIKPDAPLPVVYSSGFSKYGNFSSGTCPVAFHELRKGIDYDGFPIPERRLKSGDVVAIESLGGGIDEAGALIGIR